MEIGENINAVVSLQKGGKCAICSGSHGDPKRVTITKTAGKSGWAREENMAGKLEQVPEKLALYPKGNTAAYPTEGHHCLAFSAFVTKGKDFILRLNFFLEKGGYKPNRIQNSILLPGRPDYDAFWTSIDLGHPLQMHIGGHSRTVYDLSRNLLIRLMVMYKGRPQVCKDETLEQIQQKMVNLVTQAENHAFMKIASNAAPWRLHPKHHGFALEMYWEKRTVSKLSPTKRPVKGHGGTALRRGSEPRWPKPKLDEGPFAGM